MMMNKRLGLLLFSLIVLITVNAQDVTIVPRARVIVDNDFGGDPDGLFQLTHQVLSPSTKIVGIIGSHLKKGDGFDNSDQTATHAAERAKEVLHLLKADSLVVKQGSNKGLKDLHTPIASEGAKLIVKEAMRTDVKTPLYVVCGAGLTEVASAYLLEPKIENRIILVWIGGPEYEGLAIPPPNFDTLEYNLAIDVKAAQVVFNSSKIPIWQIPRNGYRQCLASYAELKDHVEPAKAIGPYLMGKLRNVMNMANKWNIFIGETYILGDSPLVLLTSLQSSFQADPSSSSYALVKSPVINDKGLYATNPAGREIRVYNNLDIRLMMSDFYSKLKSVH
jgi:inosine-uridine nucleoside N-ribohydrolase